MSGFLRIRRPPKEGVVPVAKQGEFDWYFDRLFKMFPGEAEGLYIIGVGFIASESTVGIIILSVVCLAIVIGFRTWQTAQRSEGERAQLGPVAVATGAFLLWLYAEGGPFELFDLHVPLVGSVLILAYTFVVPLIYKGPPD